MTIPSTPEELWLLPAMKAALLAATYAVAMYVPVSTEDTSSTLWYADPIHKGLLPLRVAPPGAVHVLVTITVLSTDESNWTLHNKVRFLPVMTT